MLQGDPSDSASPQLYQAMPLFPLPNVVLFPRAVLPLHIFEERYKAMTADALAGDSHIAMALLKDGWEKNYYSSPAVEPVVCIGRILTHEELADGKYNFLLEGVARAKIIREHEHAPYRTADLQVLTENGALDMQLDEQRHRLTRSLQGELHSMPGARQFLQMLSSPMATATIADLIAFHLLDDTQLKQSLLGDADVRRRVTHVAEALESIHPPPPELLVNKPRFPSNPSMN